MPSAKTHSQSCSAGRGHIPHQGQQQDEACQLCAQAQPRRAHMRRKVPCSKIMHRPAQCGEKSKQESHESGLADLHCNNDGFGQQPGWKRQVPRPVLTRLAQCFFPSLKFSKSALGLHLPTPWAPWWRLAAFWLRSHWHRKPMPRALSLHCMVRWLSPARAMAQTVR